MHTESDEGVRQEIWSEQEKLNFASAPPFPDSGTEIGLRSLLCLSARAVFPVISQKDGMIQPVFRIITLLRPCQEFENAI